MSLISIPEVVSRVSADRYYSDPFPHIVIDNFLPDMIAGDLYDLCISRSLSKMKRHDNKVTDYKFESNDMLHSNSSFVLLDELLRSSEYISAVSTLLGINEPLEPDTELFGSGIHCMPPGGFLEMHLDFRSHPKTKLMRRLNTILYLNKSYEKSHGGNLVIANINTPFDCKSIEPLFNRLVIFPTNDFTLHGVPQKIPRNAPPRNSIAYYHYSKSRPLTDIDPHRGYDSTFYLSQSPLKSSLISLLRTKTNFLRNFTK